MTCPDFARRHLCHFLFAGLTVLATPSAWALELSALSNKDAVGGLKAALVRGAETAVGQLGQPNGFLGDERVRIPLPESVQQVEKMMRTFGYGKRADALIETMNRAAETAVVEAKPLLVTAVKKMKVSDAKNILSGPQDAATQYFRNTTSMNLTQRFLPIVKKATAEVKLAEAYNRFGSKAARFGLVDAKDANLDNYVTQKALDGLFLIIAEQEKKIREDPVGTGSTLIKKVFGSLF